MMSSHHAGGGGGFAGAGGMHGGGAGGGFARGGGGACGVGQGEECGACGVSCGGGGAGSGALSYVGTGQGAYIQETTYKYVGCGGDFDAVRPRRDFTCIITTCCLLSLLLLLPLLLWLFSGSTGYDCTTGAMMWETSWSPAQQQYCCSTAGVGCSTTSMAPNIVQPTPPPTPPPPTPPPAPLQPTARPDPNCAIGDQASR